jgi:hypothetical protein
MAGMNITDKRKEAIAFTEPYGRTPSTFAVLKSSPLAKLPMPAKSFRSIRTGLTAAEKSINEIKPLLKGKVIGVQTSTAQANFSRSTSRTSSTSASTRPPSSTTSTSRPAASTASSRRSRTSKASSKSRRTRT